MADPQDPLIPRITKETEQPAYVVPGSQRAAEIARQEAQQGFGQDFADGFGSTAAAGLYRYVNDEAAAHREQGAGALKAIGLSLTGYRAEGTDYDKEAKYPELTQDIPYEYHDEIMGNDSLEGAARSRRRIMEDLDRGRRMSQQDTGTAAILAGSLFDVDLPLTLFSGGAFGAAKASRAGMKLARVMKMSPRAALRSGGAAQGLNAGVQAGLAIGATDMAVRETSDWTDLANMTFTASLLGTGVGTALKGDVRSSVKAAQDEFHARVARDDPSLTEDLDVEAMADGADDLSAYTAPLPEEGSTAGAAQTASGLGRPQRTLTDPAGTISPRSTEIIDAADTWRHDTGWADRKVQDDAEWWSRVALTGAGSFTADNYRQLYKSRSAVANWLAGAVFESASGLGRGRATAAVRMENYHKRIQTHIARDVEPAMNDFARDMGMTWKNSGYSISTQGRQVFNREVMLELNDRAIGRPSTRNPAVQRAADQYEKAGAEALSVGRGRDGETAVDGFEGIPDRRGYTPYVWSGKNILHIERQGIATRDDIAAALADGYRQAGMGSHKDALAVAKAVIHRAVTKEADIDNSVVSLLAGDGQEFLRESLRMQGMKDPEVDAILDRLVGKAQERGKEGFAKARNDIDMDTRIRTTDGSELRIVDLFDQDLHGVWQRYSRRMAGAGAMARVGVTNKVQRKHIITALQAEQRALGEEPMDADLLEAMFSHFNGGPVWGYSRGFTNEGIGAETAVAKRMTNIALLERLGLTQLAETGATIAQNGIRNWWTRGPAALFDKELKAGNKALIEDMAFFTGRIGDDHRHFATWLDLDDVSTKERGDWLRHAQKWSSNAQWLQGYTSAFNHVRSFQQTTAALGIADKVMREVKKAVDTGGSVDAATLRRFRSDLGLMEEDITALENLVNSGVVEFQTRNGTTFVNRLNMEQWDTELGEVFASSITRNVNQLVQKSMAGEQDAWMHTQWGSIMMHLKTFPFQAIQKQFIRNMRHMDMQNMTTLLYGMATAGAAIRVRDAIDGRERSAEEYASAAFNYSNMTGFIPMLADPAMTILGLEDYRFNKYGPYTDMTPPMFSVANDMRRIPGALWDTAAGNGDYYDRQALKAIPFAGTYLLSRAFDE